jgi:predicted nuclease with TOPRIM domain
MRETEFQRDEAVAKLQDTLDVVSEERKFIRSLEVEKNTTFEDLRRERAEFAALEKQLTDSQTQNETLTSQLAANQKELEKIQETHTRLNRMAQETLGEVSALRQQGENLEAEKEHFSQLAQSRDRRIMELSREIDNLRADLLSHATTVQVSRSEGKRPPAVTVAVDSETGAVSTEQRGRPSSAETPTSDIAVGTSPVTHPESEGLGFNAFYDNAVTELQKRYARALDGDIAWDTFDIVVVSTLSCLALGLLAGLIFFFRLRYLKRTVKRLRAQMRRKPQRSGVAAVPVRVPDIDVGVERRAVVEEQPSTRGNFNTDQPSPEDFSPIFRSSPADEEEQEEYEEEENDEVQTMMIQPAAERAGRRVIGAFNAEDSSLPAFGGARVEESSTTTTQSSQDYFTGGEADDSDDDFSATQMIPDSFPGDPTPDLTPSSKTAAEAGAGGSEEEQELLDELKAIISKKLDT